MIGFEQSNGIDRVLWLLIPVSHGMLSLSPGLGSGACRVGVNPLVFPALMARRSLWGVDIALFLAFFLTAILGGHPVKSYVCCVMTSQYRASTI
jgi:hypothetical protein